MTAGAYRGYGATQGQFAVESAVNELAEKLHMDPTVLRDQNMVKEALIPRFLDCFYAGCKDDELKAYVDSVVAPK